MDREAEILNKHLYNIESAYATVANTLEQKLNETQFDDTLNECESTCNYVKDLFNQKRILGSKLEIIKDIVVQDIDYYKEIVGILEG